MEAQTGSPFTFRYVHASEVTAIGANLPAVSICIVALRFYTRMRQSVQPGIDDWLILGGLVGVHSISLGSQHLVIIHRLIS